MTATEASINEPQEILSKLNELCLDLLQHDGFGDLRLEVKILRRGQKEVIIHCGKQYRFVISALPEASQKEG
jgi:hypothetical protein